MNEFREFFGLPKHQHFEDINADSGVTDALRDLYDDPDMVELYPGLLCEGKGRCLDPGTLGPNDVTTALWGGVFCDAVTLVRSDRFYTVVSCLPKRVRMTAFEYIIPSLHIRERTDHSLLLGLERGIFNFIWNARS